MSFYHSNVKEKIFHGTLASATPGSSRRAFCARTVRLGGLAAS
jgi:hypothetical protein